MNFSFEEEKKCFVLELSRFLCFGEIHRFVTSSRTLLHNRSYTYAYFFWPLHTITIKFGQILVCLMANISNMFLGQCYGLETSSRPFYDFIKLTIYQDPAMFNSEHLPFLIAPYSPFQKMECWNLNLIHYWVIGADCLIEKDLECSSSPPSCSKELWELLPMLISINWLSLMT